MRADIMIKNPWQSKEWLQKRDALLKDAKCEYCGSVEKLCVHHSEHIFKSPRRVKCQMYSRFFNEFKNLFIIMNTKKSTKTGNHRHKSHPYWHPINRKHNNEIDESDIEIQYASPNPTPDDKKQFKLEYEKWLKSIDAESLINAEIEKERLSYMSFENVQVLCNKCHIAHHRGKDLCPVCKTKYKTKRYETCWDCIPEERKKEIEAKERKFEMWLQEFEDFDNED